MKRHNIGTIIVIIFCIAVIIYVMISGGVHAEKPDDSRFKRSEETSDLYSTYRNIDTVGSACDIRKDEVTINEETTDSWLDSVLIQLDTVATEEAEENIYTDCEVNDEEWYEPDGIDDSDSDHDSDSWDGDWTGGTDEVVGESPLDIWDMGLEWYGISYEDTNRTLRLITYEGYNNSLLSYYVACCCWVRATEGYWGYGNLYSAFGEIDTQYGLWMDSLEIADWAYYYLEMCYQNPTYCKYVNGLVVPSDYIYYEDGIYCWN